MSITLELFELRNLLADAAELGATRALIHVGQLRPFLSQSEAYKIYGRKLIERWIKEGLIKAEKDGARNSGVRLDRLRLEVLAKSSNRASYFNYRY